MELKIPHVDFGNNLYSNVEQMSLVLDALPDPAFLLSRSGKYLAVYGGKDTRYYHDGTGLVGSYISDLVKTEKANWFIEKIDEALQSRTLLIAEYELSSRDVKGLPDDGPSEVIWFEGRIQALDFRIDDEDVVLWVASNISRRHALEMQLRELSNKDQLTALFNRRKLEKDLKLQFAEFTRYKIPTSILIFDLDNLKQINDTSGHHIGDQAIVTVANTCRSQLRKNDIAYRLGGDEFVIVLPNLDLADAIQFASRLHECFNVGLSQFSRAGKYATISMGIATISCEDNSYENTLKRADSALYEAKRNGKNCVKSA